jgi:hypothetical protein
MSNAASLHQDNQCFDGHTAYAHRLFAVMMCSSQEVTVGL